MQLTIKYKGESLVVECTCDTILELKEKLTRGTQLEVNEMRLICGGHVLEDPLTLESYGITSDSVIYLYKESLSEPATTNPNAPSTKADVMKSVFDSSLMQELLSNPDLIQSVLQMNPRMRDLMERNPELRNLMSDPDTLQRSFAALSNPSLMREMMRSADRSMSNLEVIPGGMAALEQFHNEIQDPLWNTFDEQQETDGVSRLIENNETIQNQPMTNPWAAGVPVATCSIQLHGVIEGAVSQRRTITCSQDLTVAEFLRLREMEEELEVLNILAKEVRLVSSGRVWTDEVTTKLKDLVSAEQTNVYILQNSTETKQMTEQDLVERQNFVSSRQNVNFHLPFFRQNPIFDFNFPQPTTTERDEHRFEIQLQQLEGMGFTDREELIRLLIEFDGNINLVLDKLL